jgi:tetratricopeptide (TPR) repeat protein
MAEITFEQSLGEIERFQQRVADAKKEYDWAGAVAAYQEMLGHPCAHHQVLAYEIWDEIHQLHRQAGDFDAAIDAKRAAIAAGYRSEPDPEADIAECHILAGDFAAAARLYGALRDKTPDDPWLYNSAGWAYAQVGAHADAVEWLAAGIEVAFRTGDPEQVLWQLVDMLDTSRQSLGQDPDPALHARVERFCAQWQPPRPSTAPRWANLPPSEDRACGHCGYDPDRTWKEHDELTRRRRRRLLAQEAPEALAQLDALPDADGRRTPARLGPALNLSVGWFPAGEWEQAIAAWPDLLGELPADYPAYAHAIEARVKGIQRGAFGQPMSVAPFCVEELVAFCQKEELDPGSAEARSAYAAELARTGRSRPWPPGRNDLCWCGSARKYKHCCGPVPAADGGG